MMNKDKILKDIGYKDEVKKPKPIKENNETKISKYNESIDKNSLLRGF